VQSQITALLGNEKGFFVVRPAGRADFNAFNLLAIPNEGMPTIPWKGALKISDGSFSGVLMLPGSNTDITAGTAQVSGVFLQNHSLSSVGTGLVKIPVNGPKGSYRTAALDIDGNH
jgi:hypothetical protein